MDENKFLEQVAAQTGLRHYPRQGPWGRPSGSAMGAPDGILTILGFARANNQTKIAIVLRFKKFQQTEMLKTAIKQSPALAGKNHGALAATGEDFVRWEWVYSLKKPKVEEVAGLANALRETIKPIVQPFDGKCEKCQFSSTPDLTLLNGLAMYICAGCQERVRMEQDQAAMNYSALQPNYPNGFALGVGAAILGGLAWGLLAYGIKRIFLYGAIVIGYFVAMAMIKGTRKVTLLVQLMVPLLTIAAILFGDSIYFVLSYMKETASPFSMKLFTAVIGNIWKLEVDTGNVVSLIFGLIGAGFSVWHARKPKFRVTFEPLGAPGK
jgi:hypothetical protein